MTEKSDNPLNNATLARLEKAETAGPYVYTCRNGKDTVTFPDLAEMDWDEGEEFMKALLEDRESVWMRKYLSPAEYDLFRAEKLKMKELVPVIRDISRHYSQIFGTPGEE